MIDIYVDVGWDIETKTVAHGKGVMK